MTETVDAIYENGVLRPLRPLKGVAEQARVRITVDLEERPPHPLRDCVGILPDSDAKELLEIIGDEFEKVDLREWQ